MAIITQDYGSVGGGGGNFAFRNHNLSANEVPSWTGTPFVAKQVYLILYSTYNWIITNVNPTTNEIETDKVWSSTDFGATWSSDNTKYWTISGTDVTLSSSILSRTATATFIISDADTLYTYKDNNPYS